MRFSRQIQLLLSLLLLVVLGGSFAVNVYHAREYLNQQLGAHAQDTASALGLALGPVLMQGDQAGMESMVTAIADRGYYRRIAVESVTRFCAGRRLEEERLPRARILLAHVRNGE